MGKTDNGLDTSRWAAWVAQPPACAGCGRRVTLKQSHRQCFDERTQSGAVWHSACDPFTVEVVVTKLEGAAAA